MKRQKPKLIVFYDSWCPVCSRTKNILMKIDWLERLDYASIRDLSVLDKYPLDPRKVEKRMHTIWINEGKFENGIRSIISIAKQVPLLWLFVPFLYMSLYFGFGVKMYDWLASKRKVLPVGGCDGDICEIAKK